jgi:hypothetical protein
MRNRFTENEIFDNIFRGCGGYPRSILHRLLKPHNPDTYPADLAMIIPLCNNRRPESIYYSIEEGIKQHGALIVENFKLFKEFVAPNGELSFSGNFQNDESITQFTKEEMPNVLHALLVVGVRRTGEEQEATHFELLLQNSWKEKPFVAVGYDLLLSMGVKRLLAIESGVRFENEQNSIDHQASMICSGSPRRKVQPFNDDASGQVRWRSPVEDEDATHFALDYLIPIDLSKRYVITGG